MEEIKVKKKKPLFSRFEWICIIIFAVFGIVGIILHFLGFDDIKGNAAEVQTLASQTDYLLVSKNDPYIMIGTPDPDGELETTVLKVDSFGFYNYFKAPADLIIDPFHSAFVGWNTLYNAIMGVSNTTINDGSSLLRYRMSAGNLNEFTGYMPVTTISHQDYNIVKGCIYAEGGGYAWLSTSNFVKPAPVPRIQGDLINAYYFYVWEGDTSHYYAVTTTGALHLHRASSSDAASRIVYRDGMMLYSYESGFWQGPIGASQSMLDGLGLPYIMNFENAAGMVMYDDACMAAVWMQSFPDQQTSVSPTPTPSGPQPGDGFDYKYRWDNAFYYLSENFPDYEVLLIFGSAVSDPYPMRAFMVPDSDFDASSFQRISDGYFTPHYPEYYCAQSSLYDIEFVYDRESEMVVSVTSGPSSRSTSFNVTGSPLSYTFYGYNVAYKPAYYTGSLWTSSFQGRLFSLWDFGSIPDVTPTPSPSPSPSPSPTPEPTPTPAYTVHVEWPTAAPTPTPVVKFDPVFPSSMPPLNSGTVSSVLETGNTYLDNNNAITVLSRALAFVPNTVLSLWWFWLFVLVILAGIRVFIHFF